MRLSGRVPDLAALDILLAVVDAGSISAAAKRVGLTQQAVSSRVASIEAQSGVTLFTRSTSGSRLTAEGIVVAEWAAGVVAAAQQLDVGLATLRSDRRAELRVSASLTIAEHLLPAWLVSFHRAARAQGLSPAAVNLTAENSFTVIEHVRSGSADVGFIESPGVPADVRSRVVARDELVLVCRPDHPLTRRRSPVDAATLARTPMVSREEGSGTRGALVAALRVALGPNHETADPLLKLSSTAAIRAAVIAGAGPAILSDLAVVEDLGAHRLARVPVVGLDLRRALRAIWIGNATPPPGPARDLIGHVLRRV